MVNLSGQLKAIEAAVKNYSISQYPGMAGKKALRFIDDNFRSQSWEGQPWKRRRNPNAKGNKGRALLVKRGILRRSFRMQAIGASVRIYTEIKYARVHNEGFRGVVNIPAHKRRAYGLYQVSSVNTHSTRRIKTETSSGMVRAHTRYMRIPRRQYMPTPERPSITFNNIIKRQVTLDVMKIAKQFS